MADKKDRRFTLLSLVDSERRLKATLATAVLVATFAAPVLRPTMPKLGVAALQILGAVAGAYLGTLLQKDRTQLFIIGHVRSSVRHLFDVLGHLRSLVVMVSECKIRLREELSSSDRRILVARTEEWLDRIEDDARKLIVSVASSTENWKDLNEGAYLSELQDYQVRDSRLSAGNGDEVAS